MNMKNQTEQRFQSFLTRVRPHRIAVLVNSEDPNWYSSCLGVIEFLTKLWGGSYCVIIPTDGKSIDEEFWTILSSHDPDILYRYQPTGADKKDREPLEFDRAVSQSVKEWASQNGFQEEQARGQVEKSILKSFFDPWTISSELNSEILMRLALFHLEKQPVHNMPDPLLQILAITKGSKPAYPLTSITEVVRAGNKRTQVTQLGVNDATDGMPAPPKLWLAATIGCGDEVYFKELSEQEINPIWTEVNEFYSVDTLIRAGIRPWRHTVDSFPFGLTTAALTSVRTGAARRFELPTIVVVGNSLKDFCLYFNLYWQQGTALWLPPWFIPAEGEYPNRLMIAVGEAEEAAWPEHNEHFVLVSYSVPQDELQKLAETIRGQMSRMSVDVQPINTGIVAMQVRHPSRVHTDGDLGNITTHSLLNNNLPGWFDSPVPRTLKPASPISHRWIVDVTFMGNLIPRHPRMGRLAISGSNLGDVRAGLDCVSYMCPGVGVFGDHMETNLLRPGIHVPDAEEIFRVILDECGYQTMTSDKGRYEAMTVQKFGDLEKTGYALWSDKHRMLLQKYRDKSASAKEQGVFLKEKRRYLDFQSMNKILGRESLTRHVIDEYIEKGVLYRGFIFRCENCSDSAWHSIADVDQTFTCRRCGLRQQFKSTSWKTPDEPSWFYKLDEMVYLMLEHNGHVPLLTLNQLRLRSKDSFLYRPEIRLTQKGSSSMYLELDLCCVADGKLCIGEAKSNDSLEGDKLTPLETAERYRDLALKMGATMVVFSTSADAWNLASRKATRAAFMKHPHIEVLEWTSAMLYGDR
jgi:hypothetical protein